MNPLKQTLSNLANGTPPGEPWRNPSPAGRQPATRTAMTNQPRQNDDQITPGVAILSGCAVLPWLVFALVCLTILVMAV